MFFIISQFNSWEPEENLNFDPEVDSSFDDSIIELSSESDSEYLPESPMSVLDQQSSQTTEEQECFVERIEEVREKDGKNEYLIKWIGRDWYLKTFILNIVNIYYD